MIDSFSRAYYEDATAVANDFMLKERGSELDGAYAASQVADRVVQIGPAAADFLTAIPFPGSDGFYVPLSKYNANQYSMALALLPGHMVLVPSTIIGPGQPEYYPAVVSEDGLANNSLRLHVLAQPYRQKLGDGAHVTLSGAGQSETTGVGQHGRLDNDGAEAEHFTTLMAASSDARLLGSWQAGAHINHQWRNQDTTSVTTQLAERLHGDDTPQKTITITEAQIISGAAQLLWHKGLRDSDGNPETATRPNALVVVQGLGFQALSQQRPGALDDIRRLIA